MRAIGIILAGGNNNRMRELCDDNLCVVFFD